MTTSLRTPFLAEVLDSSPIPEIHLEYFRTRLKLRLYTMIQHIFRALQADKGLSKTDLARRLGKDPALISRWMNSPGNLEVNTISDLLLAMRREPILGVQNLEEGAIPPTQEAWLHSTSYSLAKASDLQALARFAAIGEKVTEQQAKYELRTASTIFDVEDTNLSPVIGTVPTNSALEMAREVRDQSQIVGLSVPAGALLQANRPSMGIHV